MTERFANRINRVAVSPTMAVLVEAEKLRARGLDVVDFGPGEPDFPTPAHIKQAAIEALERSAPSTPRLLGSRRFVKLSAAGMRSNWAVPTSPVNPSSAWAASTHFTTPLWLSSKKATKS